MLFKKLIVMHKSDFILHDGFIRNILIKKEFFLKKRYSERISFLRKMNLQERVSPENERKDYDHNRIR